MIDKLNNIWIEKYRPRRLNDLCISTKTKQFIESYGQEIPHLLFIGPPGRGKTTLAQILVKDILKCDYIYINASDENGIETVRTKISGFIQTKSFDGNLKVVVLDEADQFSSVGQGALRNMMESYAEHARFILTGNFKHKIQQAIQSRCQTLEIDATMAQAFKRCLEILKLENIEVSKNQKKLLAGLVKGNFPDIRRCIGEMQQNCIGGVLEITHQSNTNMIVELIVDNINDKKSLVTRKYLIENEDLFKADWEQLLSDLLNHIYKSDMTDSRKKNMVLVIADHLEKNNRVSDKEINFFACMLNLEHVGS
jgi:DNA polymerase III delta prime subunit